MTVHDGRKKLEASYVKQLSLLRELRDCLEEESRRLTQREVDSLWDLFERKMAILRALESCGTEVRELLEASGGIPEGEKAGEFAARGRFQELWITTARVREEVRKRARENMNFVQDCLAFLDQLAASFAGAGQPSLSYGRCGRKAAKGVPLIVRREV